MKLFAPLLTVFGIAAQILALCALAAGIVGATLVTGSATVFFLSTGVFSVTGLIALILGRVYQPQHLSTRHMFLITTGTWLLMSVIASLPLLLVPLPISHVDAVFETVSGLTTTGSTVLTGLDALPADVLLWRSMLQWLGGIGVICMAILLLPFLHVGGMRLFQTESSHWENSDNVPRTKQVVLTILRTYALLTVLCTAAYMAGGMTVFNAVNHAMTTVSTGGYSTSDSSFMNASLLLQWIAVVFMFAGSVPFTLYPFLISRHATGFWHDQQVRGSLMTLCLLTVLLSGYLLTTASANIGESVTRAAFNLVSIVTTTGYASFDYTGWGSFAAALFFAATFIGGCSGSTSGGIKIFRLQIMKNLVKDQLKRTVHPRITLTSFYAGRPLKPELISALLTYFVLMLMSLVVITLAMTFTGLDLVTSLSGAATALMNVGPGLGDTIGPAGNFAALTDPAKWLLCAGMLLGRLEFLTVIVLFTASYWRA